MGAPSGGGKASVLGPPASRPLGPHPAPLALLRASPHGTEIGCPRDPPVPGSLPSSDRPPGRAGRAGAFPRSSWGAGAGVAHREERSGARWRTGCGNANSLGRLRNPSLAHSGARFPPVHAPLHTQTPPGGGTPPTHKNVPRRGKLPNAKNASYFGTGAPSAPEGDFAALGGCETRRTGPSPSAPAVRQRAPGGAPRRLAEVRASPNLRSDQHQHRHERQAQGEERPKHVLLWRVCPVCTCASLGPQQRPRRLA